MEMSNRSISTNVITHSQKPTRTIKDAFNTFCELIGVLLKVHWIILQSIYRLIVPPPEKSVKGEIVLITGGGNGIGRELAIQYASHGSTVVCWDIDKLGMEETMKAIQNLEYPKAYSYVCDISNREEVMQMAEKVQKEVGHVTILVNNAGIMITHPFISYTVKELQATININLMGHFWTLQAFLPHMIEVNHGHILAISSLCGVEAPINLVPYSVSKFGVCALMCGLLKELNCNTANQIKVTTINPYMVGTSLLKTANVRFPNVFSILHPKNVAKVAIKAQRRNLIEAGVPHRFLITGCLLRLLPVEAKNLLYNFFHCEVDSDL